MAPINDANHSQDSSESSMWLAYEIAAAVGVVFTILFSILICNCCGGDGTKKRSQKFANVRQGEQPPANNSTHYRDRSPKATSSFQAAGPAPERMEGSFLRNSKISMKSGRARTSGRYPQGKGLPPDVVEFAPEGDPRYKSMVELDGSSTGK